MISRRKSIAGWAALTLIVVSLEIAALAAAMLAARGFLKSEAGQVLAATGSRAAVTVLTSAAKGFGELSGWAATTPEAVYLAPGIEISLSPFASPANVELQVVAPAAPTAPLPPLPALARPAPPAPAARPASRVSASRACEPGSCARSRAAAGTDMNRGAGGRTGSEGAGTVPSAPRVVISTTPEPSEP
jgi:hypothetical protein